MERATRNLNDAVDAVEREAIPALLKEAAAIQADLFRRRQVLLRLARDYPTIEYSGSYSPTPEAAALRSFLQSPTMPARGRMSLDSIVGFSDQVAAAAAPWNAARAALARDPDAELPAP